MNARPRIAIVVPGFVANEIDTCIPALTTFVRGLARICDVKVFTGEYPYRFGTYAPFGIEVTCTSYGGQTRAAAILSWLRLERTIVEEHRFRPFDVIHGFWATRPGFVATRVASRLGIPSVLSISGGETVALPEVDYGSQRKWRHRVVVHRAIQSASICTAGSMSLSDHVENRYGRECRTVPLGIDTSTFATADIRDGFRLLTVASMIPVKDYPTMLRATAALKKRHPRIQHTFVGWNGNVKYRSHIEHLVQTLGLVDSVRIEGAQDHRRLPAYYQSHDIFIQASHYESQGVALAEALSTGMPAVSTRVGIAGEIDDDVVLKFDPGCHEDLAGAVDKLVSSSTLRGRAHSLGPRIVREKFDALHTVNAFDAIYRELLSGIPSTEVRTQRHTVPITTSTPQ